MCYSSRPKALSRFQSNGAQLHESRGGRPGLPVPNSPCSFCGRKATLNHCSQMKQPTVIFGGGETDALIRTCIFCDLQCMVTTPATADRQRFGFQVWPYRYSHMKNQARRSKDLPLGWSRPSANCNRNLPALLKTWECLVFVAVWNCSSCHRNDFPLTPYCVHTMADSFPYTRSGWQCCFTSTETVGLLGTGAQDGHLHFHTAPELCTLSKHGA